MNKYFSLPVLALLIAGTLVFCQSTTRQETDMASFQDLSGPYFGREPPRDNARLFMPGLISTYGRNGNITFLDEGTFCVFTSDETGTRFTYLKDGRWTTPQPVPWGRLRGLDDYTLGGDGKTFYWQSVNPTDEQDRVKDMNLWKSERNGVRWTEPTPLPDTVNHPQFNEIYPTTTADGSVYYFCDDRPDSRRADIYVNRVENGAYAPTERLPWPINSDYGEFDFIVAPDESYLIFASSRPGGYGQCDNYVCFRRDDGHWTHPMNMGDRINSYGSEFRNFVSHDGKCFFFGSTRDAKVPRGEKFVAEAATRYGDNDVYWIDASIISELRETALTKTCAADIIRDELQVNGLQSAIEKLKELHSAGEEHYTFSFFELLDLCEHLIDEDRADDAEDFYTTLLETFDPFRIQHGYAFILSNHGNLGRAIALLDELVTAGEEMDLPTTLDYLFYDLKARGKTEDAIRVLQLKTERFPDSYHAYCYLAEMYEDSGDMEKAKAACEKAIELNPDFVDAKEILERLNSRNTSEYKGEYLGQKPPGLQAVQFNNGVLVGDKRSFNVSFSPDGDKLFFSYNKSTPERRHPEYEIKYFKQVDGMWHGPEVAFFSGQYSDVDVTFSPDGKKLFFTSDRPHPDSADMDIYYLEKSEKGWSEPIYAGTEVNTNHNEVHAALSTKGNLFFASNRPGGFGDKDLYKAEWVDGKFTNVTNLGPEVNSGYLDSDCFIAQDESYIVFDTIRPENGSEPYIYVSFQTGDNEWSKAVSLGEEVNTKSGSSAPTLSPDGKYLFFKRRRGDNRGIHWISTEIIENLKKEILNSSMTRENACASANP
jgi:tetratricopeptide (TPR) repeat protein